MKMFCFTLSLIIALLGCNVSRAQWSLEKCISYAKENNLQVRQSLISVKQSKNTLLQSKLHLLPAFSGSLTHGMSWGRSVNLQTLRIIKNKRNMYTTADIGASINIFDGLANVYTIKSNAVQLKIAEQQVEKLKNEITIQITQAYLQVLLSQEVKESAEENLKSTTGQVEKTAKLVEAGSQAYSTLLEVKAQLADEKVKLVEAKNQVRTNILTLTQLLNLPATEITNFSIQKPAADYTAKGNYIYPTETVDAIYGQATHLPQIRSAELSLEKSKYDYKAAYGKLFPSLSIGSSYSSNYSQNDKGSGSFFTQFDHNKSPALSFSVNIPIFNGLAARSSVNNSRLAMENSRLDLEIQKQNLYKEVQSAYNEAFSALEKMKAAEENLESIKESFTYTENKFNVGMVNATDYIVAKANLYNAESSYYQAKYQYIFELKILDFYKGIMITL